MDLIFKRFVKFQGYLIGVTCIFGSITSIIDGHFVLHFPEEEFFDYRYLGKTVLFFNLLWISVGFSLIFGIFKETRKFLYPLAILFTVDWFLIILRDIVVIWINHPWAHVNLSYPFTAAPIICGPFHVMVTLIALGKLFDSETSAKLGPNFVRFKVDSNGPEELLEEDTVVLT